LKRKVKFKEVSADASAALTPVQTGEELRTLEQVREIVRQVFSSLSELPSQVNARTTRPAVAGVAASKKNASSAAGRRPPNFWTDPAELSESPNPRLAAHKMTSNTANQKGCSSADSRDSGSQDKCNVNVQREYLAGNGDSLGTADASLLYAMRAAFPSSVSPPPRFPRNKAT
jgi:hypothetical protein